MKRLQPLPLAHTGFGRHILWMMTAMIFIALCVSLISLITTQLGAEWQNRLLGRFTVVVSAAEAGDEDNRKALTARIIDNLKPVDGVKSLYAPDPDELLAMLFPWLNSGELKSETLNDNSDLEVIALPKFEVPLLVDVESEADLSSPELAAKLADQGFSFRIDDHGEWRSKFLRIATLVKWGGVVAFILLMAVAGGLVLVVASAMFATHEKSLHLLHVMGASDEWLARIFRDLAYTLAARAGIIAAVLYLLLLLVIGRFLDIELSTKATSRLAWTVSISVPAIILSLTMVAGQAARFEILRQLKRWP